MLWGKVKRDFVLFLPSATVATVAVAVVFAVLPTKIALALVASAVVLGVAEVRGIYGIYNFNVYIALRFAVIYDVLKVCIPRRRRTAPKPL